MTLTVRRASLRSVALVPMYPHSDSDSLSQITGGAGRSEVTGRSKQLLAVRRGARREDDPDVEKIHEELDIQTGNEITLHRLGRLPYRELVSKGRTVAEFSESYGIETGAVTWLLRMRRVGFAS